MKESGKASKGEVRKSDPQRSKFVVGEKKADYSDSRYKSKDFKQFVSSAPGDFKDSRYK